ncbi:MAG: HmuY family protein [Flavobacterium sp.]
MFKSNILKSVLLAVVISVFTSCTKDDETSSTTSELATKTYANLYAPQTGGGGQPSGGVFTKFSFSQNAIVTDDSWDIAFRGTTILVNGGSSVGISDEPTRTGIAAVSIVNNTFNLIKTIPDTSTFKQDGANTYAIPIGSGNGWYVYESSTNLVNPIAGKVFVIKTHDGKYAKLEIMSYYKDGNAIPNSLEGAKYFTFKYAYQPEGTNF